MVSQFQGTSYRIALRCVAALIALMTLGYSLTSAAADGTENWEKFRAHTHYDPMFSKYTKRFFGPAFSWHHFKAQAIAESGLQEDAKSGVGAQGIMQIMPATWTEIRDRSKFIQGTASDPRWNIAGGIWYDRQLFRTWVDDRTLAERLRFTFGSYNAGKGNILKAQRRATAAGLDPVAWTSVATTLPEVTGGHSRETINYVERIEDIREDLN